MNGTYRLTEATRCAVQVFPLPHGSLFYPALEVRQNGPGVLLAQCKPLVSRHVRLRSPPA